MVKEQMYVISHEAVRKHCETMLFRRRDKQSSLCDMIRRWKQATGFRHSRQHSRTLWQSGYFERILRREETTQRVATC